jgi:predicted lipoprotein with Yx(FWY)xxD motif
MIRRTLLGAAAMLVAFVVAACSGATATPTTATAAPTTRPTAAVASASPAPTSAPNATPAASLAATPAVSAPPASPAAGSPVIKAATVGSHGTLIVAASNGMTLYVFSEDVANSGTSACDPDCVTSWPPLTVAAGTTPAGGPGVSGKLGTITRSDGSTQVTYKGLPLHFFSGDSAPGDANGIYPEWSAVKP